MSISVIQGVLRIPAAQEKYVKKALKNLAFLITIP